MRQANRRLRIRAGCEVYRRAVAIPDEAGIVPLMPHRAIHPVLAIQDDLGILDNQNYLPSPKIFQSDQMAYREVQHQGQLENVQTGFEHVQRR